MPDREMDLAQSLPMRLRELRQEMGWTLDDVAQITGMTQRGVVSNWEAMNQRRRTPSLDTLVLLQRWYGVSMDYLLGHPDAERDSPTVKTGKKTLRETLRGTQGLEAASPSERARIALSLAIQVAPNAFFIERLAALLIMHPDDLHRLLQMGVWPNHVIDRLAPLLGLSREWFYTHDPVSVLELT